MVEIWRFEWYKLSVPSLLSAQNPSIRVSVTCNQHSGAHGRAWEERTMARKLLLLIMLSFSLAIGSFWVLRAQDPTTPKPETTQTQPKATANMTQQVDLSGTYAGTFNCEEAGLVGDTTLTITGNEFTTSDGRKGRLTASKTSGYTAVAIQISPADPGATTAMSKVISMRARKSGNKLTLTPVAGS